MLARNPGRAQGRVTRVGPLGPPCAELRARITAKAYPIPSEEALDLQQRRQKPEQPRERKPERHGRRAAGGESDERREDSERGDSVAEVAGDG